MIVNFGERWDSINPILERVVERGGFLKEGDVDTRIDKSLALLAPFTGNNPFAKSDFFSRFGGSTQNGTSVGWWGIMPYAVLTIPDLLGYISSAPSPSGRFSFVGWSKSSNAGAAFTDKGDLWLTHFQMPSRSTTSLETPL